MSDPASPTPNPQQPPQPAQPPQPPPLQWNAVGNAADWPENGSRLVKIGARRLGVYHHGGKWYAMKDMCPHAGVSLSQGPVHECQVMCVGHGWLFSLESGECTRGPTGVKVATYPVRVVDGKVEVEA
jgi:NAD(P)H-dependent nitrite reductase small subunit